MRVRNPNGLKPGNSIWNGLRFPLARTDQEMVSPRLGCKVSPFMPLFAVYVKLPFLSTATSTTQSTGGGGVGGGAEILRVLPLAGLLFLAELRLMAISILVSSQIGGTAQESGAARKRFRSGSF